jgi:hypothetical protein
VTTHTPLRPDPARGYLISVDDYLKERTQLLCRRGEVLTLHRTQERSYSNNPSWMAFRSGDWTRAMELIAQSASVLRSMCAYEASCGQRVRIIQVVASHLTASMQWRLHVLAQMAHCGREVRVVTADHIHPYEYGLPVADLTCVHRRVVYQTVYNQEAEEAGAIRYQGRWAAWGYRRAFRKLWDLGMPADEFFVRRIVDLPPPRYGRRLPGTDW